MKSLAIEREFGSGGREIGINVAKAMGLPYYDTELLVKAANEFGISIGEIQQYDEVCTGSFLHGLIMAASCTQGVEDSELYKIQYSVKETIRRLELKGPTVFIGRCATEILKYHPEVIRVFIYSSSEQKKTNRILLSESIASEREAKELMEKKDRSRKNYFKFWTGKEWKNQKNYDLGLNTGMLTVEQCTDILINIVQK